MDHFGGSMMTLARSLLLVCAGLAPVPALAAIEVTFLNPGHADPDNASGPFWRIVTDFADAVADDLDIRLETLHAERNHVRMVEQGRRVLARDELPDYLIVVNEKRSAQPLLEAAAGKDVEVLLIMNALLEDQRRALGEPRGRIDNWIGTLLPNNERAGYKIADEIIADLRAAHGADTPVRMGAIAGDKGTYASIERVKGLERAAREHADVTIEQITMGHWRHDTAEQKAAGMLSRYPDLNAIWAANDPMAYGAIRAISDAGAQPGQDVFVGGLNLEQRALEHVRDGRMAVTVGGHFMTAGWALVLLYDYHHGHDFWGELESVGERIFGYVTAANVERYRQRLGDADWDGIDFTRFSKEHGGHERYRLGLSALLEGGSGDAATD
jgi:ABC-type sugar transport system substrate-binding protein